MFSVSRPPGFFAKVRYPNIPAKTYTLRAVVMDRAITVLMRFGDLCLSSWYIMGILSWYMHAKMIRGSVLKTPFTDTYTSFSDIILL